MSRCSEGRRRRSTLLSGLALLVITGVVAQPVVAAADDRAPVLTIVAPVVDIEFGGSDLKNEVRVETLPRKTKITLDSTVLFGKDSARINAKAGGRLADVARELAARGPGTVRITGYTDDLGSAAHGKTLSRQRAAAVAKVLRRDLPAARFGFTVEGKGEADPAVPNKNEASRRINRRVVLLYEKKS